MTKCCNDNFSQDMDCPTRVAKVGCKMPAADPLPPSIWREQLKRLGYWMLTAVIGLTVWPVLVYLVLRA
jgi:hypothetical protein